MCFIVCSAVFNCAITAATTTTITTTTTTTTATTTTNTTATTTTHPTPTTSDNTMSATLGNDFVSPALWITGFGCGYCLLMVLNIISVAISLRK